MRSLRSKVILLLLSVFVVIAAEVLLEIQVEQRLTTQAFSVQQTNQVINGAQQLLTHILQAETGQRVYRLTQQENYLNLLKLNVKQVHGDIDALSLLTVAHSPQQQRLTRIQSLVDGQFTVFDKVTGLEGESAQVAKGGRRWA
ncbi:MAG: CHASE3 domain-containing protein [Gammaproteobacteria bacterium]|jgi:CHASE3 domain sensor protein|nr:CHASE3 domain-containing protein [Gammaproteobacteria bacterium]MBT3489053.1 CHASE3 domain-containing protein [Gammaproteobacteria bacterium]MBT3719586.1 CHASE3 domain-containing protein [Gammaproteobacteria bacterium]MBT3845708.1 CHASE3 domain-containing protein [Gammaproteobacteria bacterium]MBT3892640.1 CHASE3 domain-containing protein [Gammaproteobacteria bacterium]